MVRQVADNKLQMWKTNKNRWICVHVVHAGAKDSEGVQSTVGWHQVHGATTKSTTTTSTIHTQLPNPS